MTKEEAIQQLERSIEGWNEYWSGACHVVSEEDIDAIELLINIARKTK